LDGLKPSVEIVRLVVVEIVIEKLSNAKYFVFEVCVRVEVKVRVVEVKVREQLLHQPNLIASE
jgi:hypothetical protein